LGWYQIWNWISTLSVGFDCKKSLDFGCPSNLADILTLVVDSKYSELTVTAFSSMNRKRMKNEPFYRWFPEWNLLKHAIIWESLLEGEWL
jgi:hypothetical protein